MRNFIYVIIKGRLGNQLFQYAFARSLQEITGGTLVLDFSEMGYNRSKQPDVCVLDGFNVQPYRYVDVSCPWSAPVCVRLQKLVYRLIRKIHNKLGNLERSNCLEIKLSGLLQFWGIYYQYGTNSFVNYRKPRKGQTVFVRGWFESEKYFAGISESIKKELTPKISLSEDLLSLRKILAGQPSVCVSVRRGDFTADCYKNEFLVCDIDYYVRGVNLICKKFPSAIVLVCSDDIEWCKQNVSFDTDRIIYEPDGLAPLETFSLMTSCCNFVISNSTFHWWAQYVAECKDKIVVAPSVWRRSVPPVKDIYMDSWMLLDVGKQV